MIGTVTVVTFTVLKNEIASFTREIASWYLKISRLCPNQIGCF